MRTEHHEVIVGLRLAAKRGVGGVMEITEKEFLAETEKKKHSQPSLIRPPGREEYAQMPSLTRPSRKGAVGPAASVSPVDGQPLPPGHVTIVLPTIGRVNEL